MAQGWDVVIIGGGHNGLTLETYAPGFGELVEARQVITPLDIEREYGAAGGHAMHAEVALDQWFEWRPLHGHGRYRMPPDGFYLCGSGAHPRWRSDRRARSVVRPRDPGRCQAPAP